MAMYPERRPGLEARARTLLVDLAQTAVADDIGNQDGGETTLHARSFAEFACVRQHLPPHRCDSTLSSPPQSDQTRRQLLRVLSHITKTPPEPVWRALDGLGRRGSVRGWTS